MNAGVCGGTAQNHPESPGKNHVTYPRKAVPVITGYGLSTSLIYTVVVCGYHKRVICNTSDTCPVAWLVILVPTKINFASSILTECPYS